MDAPVPVAGPRVVVRNTFLDLDDEHEIRKPVLRRALSERVDSAARLEDSEDDEDEGEERDHVPTPAGLGAAAEIDFSKIGEEFGTAAAPPPPDDLYRMTTVDGYEPVSMWSWINGDPNTVCAPTVVEEQPAQPADAAGAAPPMQPTPEPDASAAGGFPVPNQCYVMIPVPVAAQPMPAQPMMMPMQGQDMIQVPVAPYARWPEPAPVATAASGSCGGPAAGAPDTPAPDLGRIITPGEPPAGAPSVPVAAGAPSEDATAALDIAASFPASDVPRAPVLERAFSVPSQIYRIRWTVDARKLKGTDREAVSPGFELSFRRFVTFKMVIRPKQVHDLRGGASFKKAKGKGSVELRCLEKVEAAAAPIVTFRIAVGSGQSGGEPPRGPVTHDFSDRAICGLAETEKEWDFSKHVDQETQTFVVVLEILSGAAATAGALS